MLVPKTGIIAKLSQGITSIGTLLHLNYYTLGMVLGVRQIGHEFGRGLEDKMDGRLRHGCTNE